MADIFSRKKRSEVMSRIRGKNTKPELIVRSFLHRVGLRYGLHRRDLPGRPDLVMPSLQTVVLVHGCFWHDHQGCRFAYKPKSNVAFWAEKIAENRRRDARNIKELTKLGWHVEIVWECETDSASLGRLAEKLLERRKRMHGSEP